MIVALGIFLVSTDSRGLLVSPLQKPGAPRGAVIHSTPGAFEMYVPSAFAETDLGKLHDFMRHHSFAVLTSHDGTALDASHLPLLLASDAGTQGQLLGHMARANPQWRRVEGEVMAVFSGPHAYISPTWYEEPGTVPTWNYMAVHAYGTFHLVEERNALLANFTTKRGNI